MEHIRPDLDLTLLAHGVVGVACECGLVRLDSLGGFVGRGVEKLWDREGVCVLGCDEAVCVEEEKLKKLEYSRLQLQL